MIRAGIIEAVVGLLRAGLRQAEIARRLSGLVGRTSIGRIARTAAGRPQPPGPSPPNPRLFAAREALSRAESEWSLLQRSLFDGTAPDRPGPPAAETVVGPDGVDEDFGEPVYASE